MKLRSSDGMLWKYAQLKEQLSAARSMNFIVQTGLKFGDRCLSFLNGKECKGREYRMKSVGKGNERSYVPVCKRCNASWPVDSVDIRAGQVDYQRHDFATRALADLTTLTKIVEKLPLWERRVWIERVFTQHRTWEDFAAHCQRKWKRKNVSVPGGFFSERHCRTLVYSARDRVERILRRARMWAGSELGEEAA